MLSDATYWDDNSSSASPATDAPITPKIRGKAIPFGFASSATPHSMTGTLFAGQNATFVNIPIAQMSAQIIAPMPSYSSRVGQLLTAASGLAALSFSVSIVSVVIESRVVGSVGAFLLLAAAIVGWLWLERAEYERRPAKTA